MSRTNNNRLDKIERTLGLAEAEVTDAPGGRDQAVSRAALQVLLATHGPLTDQEEADLDARLAAGYRPTLSAESWATLRLLATRPPGTPGAASPTSSWLMP